MWNRNVLLAGCMFAAWTMCRAAPPDDPVTDVLTPDQWQRVDASVDKALQWLASQQQRNGSFPTLSQGQPGVTSLCAMAFAAHGHLPGEGPYGKQLSQAVDFILSCQKPNGLLAQVGPRGKTLSRNVEHEIGSTASYNHAIAALVLSEVFAMGQGADREQMQDAIENALQVTLDMQHWPKRRREDRGGWRYVNDYRDGFESDLSVSGWHLMFLRSAKNAGFDVPKARIDEAVGYIRRCYQPRFKTFMIMADRKDRRSRGMAGAGILALAHGGFHDAPEAQAAGDWILKQGFERYNTTKFTENGWTDDRYHYGVFHCCQAMYQLGGSHWQRFYPPTVRVLLNNQSPAGFWPAERHYYDAQFGNAYSTALVVLTLGAPNQLLPVFQR